MRGEQFEQIATMLGRLAPAAARNALAEQADLVLAVGSRMQDFTTDSVYYERGINLRHGYLAEAHAPVEAR